MTFQFHPHANGAAERTNQTVKQVLVTIVHAKMREASEAASPNWLQPRDCLEIAINNAPIADTEQSPFYLNLGYHPQFFCDIPDLDEERLRGEQKIYIKEWAKKLAYDWAFVFRALYHELARAEEMGDRKKANYQFNVGPFVSERFNLRGQQHVESTYLHRLITRSRAERSAHIDVPGSVRVLSAHLVGPGRPAGRPHQPTTRTSPHATSHTLLTPVPRLR